MTGREIVWLVLACATAFTLLTGGGLTLAHLLGWW
jgi:hypothetical protein